jgi:FtsH-binding integral membrane protein
VKVNKGKVSVTSICNEKDIIISRLRQELSQLHNQSSDSVKTVIQREKFMPKIYKFYGYGFWTLLAIIATFALVNKNIYAMIATTIAGIIASLRKNK